MKGDSQTLSPAERRERLAELLRERGSAFHRLSRGQRALWFAHNVSPGSAAYNVMLAWRIQTAVDIPALQVAFQGLVDRHAVLRTTYVAVEGEPLQYVHAYARLRVDVHDASAWSEERLRGEVADEAHRPFDLEHGPVLRVSLFRNAHDCFVLLLVVHHIAVDVWSLGLLLNELGVLYVAARSGQDAVLPRLDMQYTDFVRSQRALLDGPEGAQLWDYWRERLAGELPVADLPFDTARQNQRSERGAAHSFCIDASATSGLMTLAATEGTTLYTLLLAAFQLLVSRYTGQTDVIVGTPAGGRLQPELAPIVGYFVNPLALRADLSKNPTFRGFLAQVRETVLAAVAHQELPFPDLVERLVPVRDPARPPLFQTSFVLQRSALVKLERDRRSNMGASPFAAPSVGEACTYLDLGELRLESFPLDQRTIRLDLELQMVEVSGVLSGFIQYSVGLFTAPTISRLARNFELLLRGIIEHPDDRVARLPIVSDEERRRLVVEWNATAERIDTDAGLHTLVEAQARRTPGAAAVLFGSGQLTYGELVERAGRLARRLRANGVGPEVPVALLVDRSAEAVVGLLAILAAGGVAVPLDPGHPQDRLAFILEDSGAPVLLTQRTPSLNLALGRVKVLSVDDEQGEAEFLSARPDQAAFIFYTSGSTGKPKGVVLTHAGLCNCFQWFQRRFQLTAEDRLIQKAPLSFDVSAWEIFWPLIAGAGVVLARPGDSRDPAALIETIKRHRVTLVQLVPSVLQLLLDLPDLTGCSSLRRVICGGEVLSTETQARFFSRFDIELYNFYGPTETSVAVTYWACRRDDSSPTVPIGRPIGNVTAYVLDTELQPVPIGVTGELYLGGACVARGYLRRDDLTDERFIPHPLSDDPGARVYRTGDLACYRMDGNLEFLGRIDRQLKVRGLRVEPGEIEAALLRHPAVRDVVVVVRTVANTRRLVAYVVAKAGLPTTAELRNFLKCSLPAYMVPSAFVVLDALPVSLMGKRDVGALPAPEWHSFEGGFVAPRSGLEHRLAELWQQLLQIKRVGIHDNFFEMGGDSVLAVQLAARANQAAMTLTPAQIFRYPTIAELAAQVPSADRAPVMQWQRQMLQEPTTATHVLLFEPTQRLKATELRRVVDALDKHHKGLRFRFSIDEGGWQSRLLDTAGIPVVKVPQELDPINGPLCCLTLQDREGDREQRLTIAIHAVVADLRSCALFVEDFELAYGQLRRGERIRLPARTVDFDHWARCFDDGGRLGTLPVTKRDRVDDCAMERLNAADTRELLEAASRHRTLLSTLLLAAAASLVLRTKGGRQLTVNLERDLRDALPQFDTSRTMGAFGQVASIALHLDEDAGAGMLLASLKKQLSATTHSDESIDLSFRYFGEVGGALLRPISLRPAGGTSAPSIESWIHDGELHFCCRCTSAQALARDLPQSIQSLGHAAARDAVSFGPADFPNARASQQDLNALLSQVRSTGGN